MTTRKTPTSREAFEKWANPRDWILTKFGFQGDYHSMEVQEMWQAWQAAVRYAKRRKEK